MSEEDVQKCVDAAPPSDPLPEPPVEDMNVPEEIRDIGFVRNKRKEIVAKLTERGIPVADPKQMGSLLTVLNDMDRTSVARIRVKADTSNASANAASAQIIADALDKIKGFVGAAAKAEPLVAREAPKLPAELSGGTFTEENKKIGTISQTYDEFMVRNPPNKPTQNAAP